MAKRHAATAVDLKRADLGEPHQTRHWNVVDLVTKFRQLATNVSSGVVNLLEGVLFLRLWRHALHCPLGSNRSRACGTLSFDENDTFSGNEHNEVGFGF